MTDSADAAGAPAKDPSRWYYGYALIGFSFVALFCASSFFLHARGLFLPYWVSEFNVGRDDIAWLITATLMTGSLMAPTTGYLLDRFPARRLILFGWCWLGAGYLLLRSVNEFAAFVVVLLLFQGIGWTYVGPLAQTKLMVNWWRRHRGMALGMAIMGISGAGMVMPQFNAWLVQTVGWRDSYLVYVGTIAVLLIPLTLLLVRQRPEDMGLQPDGAAAASVETPASAPLHKPLEGSPASGAGFFTNLRGNLWPTYQEFLTSKAFWSVVLTFGLMNGVYSAMITHLPSYLTTELDFTLTDAGWVLGAAGTMAILGKIVMGWTMDHLPPRVTVLTSVSVYLASTLVFMQDASLPLLVLAAGLFGLGFGGMVPVRSVILSRLFGVDKFSRVNGLLSFFLAPAMLWIGVTGSIAERSGSYVPAFQIWAVAFVLAGIVSSIVRLPGREEEPGVGAAIANPDDSR